MIYHTAAEKNYYNAFFKRWHSSIKALCPQVTFSLKFVGDTAGTDVIEFCKANEIDLILDNTTPDDLISRYGSMEKGRGYYPMARWNSIPVSDKDVCVTDVDVVMVKNDLHEIKNLLKENQFVSISRDKHPKVNPMMVNYIRSDACAIVRDHACSLMESDEFCWDIDLKVMRYMTQKLKYIYLHRLIKFDSTSGLLPSIKEETCFGYYSAVSIVIDGVAYEGGLEAKKAKYEYADKKDLIRSATNLSLFQKR